ncbi:actinia tenebrosa protease inhibitors-like [Daphnia pulicaria]|uniref:actinia tenebrosa protease inhibitors-like n=1 Tax=Daphnia pulicaria TaxID=35523 RepID=UPI001EEB4E38|nr:actinia tenebrosa protease inhibitors-like [Daphnia pulicaria]
MLGQSTKFVILLCSATSIVWAIPRPTESPVVENYTVANETKVVDICSLPSINRPSDAPECSGVIPRWTYDTSANACRKIFWQGCWGTENLFNNEFACLATCNKQGLQKLIDGRDNSMPCMQSKSEGSPCLKLDKSSVNVIGEKTRFFFDTQTGKCLTFDYTGCDGNRNNFESESECDLTCNGLQGPVTPPTITTETVTETNVTADGDNVEIISDDICLLPPLKGTLSCSGVFYRWTYNSTTEVCEKFVYGGCQATENVFRNQHACLAKCNQKELEKVISQGLQTYRCLQPKLIGNCRSSIPSFYYDATTGVCRPFNFSGCDGNSNNFGSVKSCERACMGPDFLSDLPPSMTTTEPHEDLRIITNGQ